MSGEQATEKKNVEKKVASQVTTHASTVLKQCNRALWLG